MDTRPTKKQRELLGFIDGFIKGNGYGPSYREIMRALGYKSVSTVAVHVDGLITRGWLVKRDHSARSLEVVSDQEHAVAREQATAHLEWLREQAATLQAAGQLDKAAVVAAAVDALNISQD
jgi:SOS-response transcriptional repressor LexA